jgi:hypothetical protein
MNDRDVILMTIYIVHISSFFFGLSQALFIHLFRGLFIFQFLWDL